MTVCDAAQHRGKHAASAHHRKRIHTDYVARTWGLYKNPKGVPGSSTKALGGGGKMEVGVRGGRLCTRRRLLLRRRGALSGDMWPSASGEEESGGEARTVGGSILDCAENVLWPRSFSRNPEHVESSQECD